MLGIEELLDRWNTTAVRHLSQTAKGCDRGDLLLVRVVLVDLSLSLPENSIHPLFLQDSYNTSKNMVVFIIQASMN